jgi:hypothetical protein
MYYSAVPARTARSGGIIVSSAGAAAEADLHRVVRVLGRLVVAHGPHHAIRL